MGIKFNCDVKIKHNFKKIDRIIKNLPNTIKESVEDVLKNIQGYAIKLEKGHHEDGILVEMIDASTMEEEYIQIKIIFLLLCLSILEQDNLQKCNI